MKHRFLLFVFAAIAGTLTALADDYIRVSNRKMSFTESWTKPSSYFNDTEGDGSVSWNASTRTLTLTDLNLARHGDGGPNANPLDCIIIDSTSPVTIEVKGNCWIYSFRGETIKLGCNATIKGDGILSIRNISLKGGIHLSEENKTLTVDGPTIKFNCCVIGIKGTNNTGTLHLKKGHISTLYKTPLMKEMGSLMFDHGMGVKSPHGAWFSQGLHCLVDVNGKVITDQVVELGPIKYYGFRIHGHEVTENNYDRINQYFGVTEGSVYYSPYTNKLVLNNATINSQTSSSTIQNYDNDGLIIQLLGENKFEFEGSAERKSLNIGKNTTIMSLESGAKLKCPDDDKAGGIYVGSSKHLTLKNVDVEAAYLAGGNINSALYIQDNVQVTANGYASGTVRSLSIVNESSRPGVAVKSLENSPRFIWNEASVPGVYQDKNTLAEGGVVLSTKSDIEWYPLYICDHRVNSLNKDCIVNEYFNKGQLAYNPDNNTLGMDGANIEYNGTSSNALIRWTPNSFSENRIFVKNDTGISNNKSGYLIINSPNNLTITGVVDNYYDVNSQLYLDGSLDVKGKLTQRDADLLVDSIVTVSSIDIDKCTFDAVQLKNYQDGSSLVPATLKDVITCNWYFKPSYSYYDSDIQKLVCNGHVSIVAKKGTYAHIIDGVKFCGQELAHSLPPANKYIKNGYMMPEIDEEEDGNIELMIEMYEGFQCDNDSRYPTFEITNPKVKKVTFYTVSCDCEFWCRQGTPFITGNMEEIAILTNYICRGEIDESRFIVYGDTRPNAGEIRVPANGKLSIGDKEGIQQEVYLPRIVGQGTSSKLIIYDPYLTVAANESGSVANISVELPTDKAELDCRDDLVRIGNDGIYLEDKLYTGQVKFVKKGEGFNYATGISVSPKTLTFTKKGETRTLTATITPANASNKEVRWSTGNKDVATVDQKGNVKAIKNGTARIYAVPLGASDDAVYAFCDVTVNIPQPTGITLSETDVLIDREGIGGFYLTANLTPSNADTEYTWESSDENVVTVRANSGQTALVRRVGDEGEATVTVTTSNGKQATCHVTIHYPITPWYVEFAQRTYTLTEVGEQLKLEPIVTPDNCEKLSFTWETSSDAISLSNDGTVTARRNGSAVVECWACYDGQKWAPGEVRINVEIPPTPVIATGLKLKAAHSIFHSLGEAFIITPVFTPENVTNQELTWGTTDASVATVDEDGFVTVVGWGDCYITATTTDGSDIKATYSVTAIDPSTIPDPIYATGIKLDENEVTLMRGEQAYIGVTIEPADYNQSVMIEPMEGDVSIAQVDAQWDWNTNRTCIYIRTEEWSEMSGDLKVRVRPNMVDWDKLNEMGIWMEPADTLTIHILAPIIFAEASPEDINITYHVTDIKDKICEVYTQTRPGSTMIDPLDSELIPAVSQTATGKLTVPAKANGYWVTHVMPCAFNRCSGLTDIEFSEGIESIGDYACYSALFSLERVTLPSTIKELGQYCFALNFSDWQSNPDGTIHNNIHEVNIKSFTPPTYQNGSDISWSGAFEYLATDAVLYVPTGALANYNVEPWTRWFSRIEEKAFFEDEDAIREVESSKLKVQSSWFDLSGRKLAGKPTKAGLYINGGKKIVISKP